MTDNAKIEHFSAQQTAALAAVLDQIIPPSRDGQLPGAGEIGLASYIETVLSKTPDLRPVIEQGLTVVDELAAGFSASRFCELAAADQLDVLNSLAESQPGFVPSLVFHTYVGYYLDGRVIEALGLEARPPYPKGYEMEPTDFSLLDPVRQRAREGSA